MFTRERDTFEEYIKSPERRVAGFIDENLYHGVKFDVYDDQPWSYDFQSRSPTRH